MDAHHVVTDRLVLDAVTASDVDALFAITSDPATWRHAPDSRHRDPATTERWISRAVELWRRDGVSYWLARLKDGQDVVGVGGVQRQATGNWNLYYRFAPNAWGHGFATELGRAALDVAHAHDNTVPVLAWVLPQNTASIGVARRLGLIDHGLHADPSDGQIRIAFADRPLASFEHDWRAIP